MMQKIDNSCEHSLKSQQINHFSGDACSQGKLIIRPSSAKINYESITFLERIQGDERFKEYERLKVKENEK